MRAEMAASNDTRLIFLELNEVNFDYIRGYAAQGKLPTFERLLRDHGCALTESEQEYEHLEPWIQWVTAHTGKSYAEHGVFRLGDIVNHEIPQIWERLEQSGLRVGAISPMNAKNRLRDAAFFVPDPWTRTRVDAPPVLRSLYAAIAQAVNDNAAARVTSRSLLNLLRGILAYASPSNYPAYLRMAATVRGHSWRKAMFLDLLLADVFMHEVRRTRPHFASLFVNAAAHIQHHYLFSSSMYDGKSSNPNWYVDSDEDPVLEVFALYDRIVATTLRRFPGTRIMIGTGLHQNPHSAVTFYWRLVDHAAFLREIGVRFRAVEPLMSRDFLIKFDSAEDARAASEILARAAVADGTRLFEIDNRGADLFVMFTYPHDITAGMPFEVAGRQYHDLRSRVAFVALKNGEHDGIGYFIDTGRKFDGDAATTLPLAAIPDLVFRAVMGNPAPAAPGAL
jgi:hypothetical protein